MSDSKWVDELYANNLLSKTSNAVQKLAKRYNLHSNKVQQPRDKLKVALLCGFTGDFLADLLPLMFFRHGFSIDIYRGGYGEIFSELLVSESKLHAFKPDLLIILPTHRDLVSSSLGCTHDQYMNALQEELMIWQDVWGSISIPIVQLSFDPPPSRPLGELDGYTAGGLLNYIRQINSSNWLSLFAYPLSGGFKSWSLLPSKWVHAVLRIEEKILPFLGGLM